MLKTLRRIVFSTIIFLIPINLGKHFVTVDAYVHSRLVDYLIPTLWLTDILILILLVLWVLDGGLKRIQNKKLVRFVIVFIAVLIPSVVIAQRPDAAIYFFLTFVLRMFFMVYVAAEGMVKENFSKIIRIFGVSVFLISVLAIFQWIKQGSVFNNYLFFGEQPYNTTSFDVAKINLFGRIRIPVYGTFRHPNIFAGFLSTALLWIYFYITQKRNNTSFLLKAAFTLGFLSLILTFSQTALFSFSIAVLFLFAIEKFGKKGVVFSLGVTALVLISSSVIFILNSPLLETFADAPSFFRRANLLKSAYFMIKDNFIFGVGLNNFTVALPDYLPLSQILVFNQPVHNIFVLLFAEAGIFVLIMFLALIVMVIYNLLKQEFGISAILFITILHFIMLGSFDHYMITIHQTQTMFWLTLGLSLAYTGIDEK